MLFAFGVTLNGDADKKHCPWSFQLLFNLRVCTNIELRYCFAVVFLMLSVCKMLIAFGVFSNGDANKKHRSWPVQLLSFCVRINIELCYCFAVVSLSFILYYMSVVFGVILISDADTKRCFW